MRKRQPIIFLSSSGFPFKISATSKKLQLMARALMLAGFKVTLITKLNTFRDLDNNQGSIDNINYIILSGKRKRSGFVDKLVGIVKAYVAEFHWLLNNNKCKIGGYLILSYCPFPMVLYYWFLAKLTNYKLIISIMEYHPAIRSGFIGKVNAVLFDNYSFYFADGALPISNFLSDLIKHRFPKLPILKVPVLADYNEKPVKIIKPVKEEKYILYCGDFGYKEVIHFVINTYIGLKNKNIKLKLVISGSRTDVDNLRNEIMDTHIEIYFSIPYEELKTLYRRALGLLIPLRPNLQDKARFPQKIAEYLSSGRPIITNNYGEIPFYFKDNVNAFIADKYDTRFYQDKIMFVLNNPALATQIGLNGQKLGRENFHYENYSMIFSNYLKSL